MAQPIPDVSPNIGSIGELSVPVSNRPIVGYNPTLVTDAISGAAQQGEKSVDYINETQDKTDVAFAKSHLLTSMVQFAKDDENNPDWQGAQGRWDKAHDTAIIQGAGMIQNSALQRQFAATAGSETEKIYSGVLQNADVRRRQDGAGKVDSLLQNNLAAAVNSPDEATTSALIHNTNDAISGAVNQRFIDPVQALKKREQWIKEYGEQKVQSFIQSGNPQGAQDWLNKHYDVVNPTSEQVQQVNSSVTVPQASGTLNRITAGQPVANANTLFPAMEQQESGGNQAAVSGKGAVGIMQLMPATAQQVAQEMGIEYDPKKLADNKEYNQALGRQYMSDMVTRYHGDQTLALAAYNAGPGNVDKWVSKYGAPAPGNETEWLKKIPFEETRNYVNSINSKSPPITMQTPQDPNNPTQIASAQMAVADGLPPSIRDITKSTIQSNAQAVIQGQIAQQVQAGGTMFDAIKQGNLTDPSQLQNQDMQSAWSLAKPDLQKAVLHAINEGQNHDVKEYGSKFYDLFKQIHAPAGDPNRLVDPTQLYKYIGPGNDLTVAGLGKLQAELAGKNTPEGEADSMMKKQFFANAKQEISGKDEMTGIPDPKGEELYLKFMARALTDYDEGKKQGKTPSQLLNPDSADYIGKSIGSFKRPLAQQLADMKGASEGIAGKLDTSTPEGLKAAVLGGHISRKEGEAQALKNGWIRQTSQVQVPFAD